MQRLDENTYLDDTLLTCVEYQLFIDEMREQRKYVHPDHWASHQFPQGKAGEAVFGVRQSDALAFCKWLTQREGGEWKYRLPTQQEAMDLPLKPIKLLNVGYWLNEARYFLWIDQAPEDPRRIITSLSEELKSKLTVVHDHFYDNALDRVHYFDLERRYTFLQALIDADKRTANRARSRANVATNAFQRAYIRILNNANALDLDSISAISEHVDFDLSFMQTRSYERNETLALAVEQARNGVLNPAIDKVFDRNLGIFIELYTLQERIAGRSPAFEGIRLAKERVE